MDTDAASVCALISVPAFTLVAPVTVKFLPLRLRTIWFAAFAPPRPPPPGPPPRGAPAPGAPGAPPGAAPRPPAGGPWATKLPPGAPPGGAPAPGAPPKAPGAPPGAPPRPPGAAPGPPRPPPAPPALIVTRPKSPLHTAAPQVGSILQSLSSAAAAIPVSR